MVCHILKSNYVSNAVTKFMKWTEAIRTSCYGSLKRSSLQETREKIFGRNVSAWGSVISVHEEMWFFPTQIRFSEPLLGRPISRSRFISEDIFDIFRFPLGNDFIKNFEIPFKFPLITRHLTKITKTIFVDTRKITIILN